MSARQERRVVVTGMALATPAGITLADNAKAWRQGGAYFKELAMAHAATTPVRYGGECPAPDVKKLPDRKVQKVLRRKDIISLLTILECAREGKLAKGGFDPERVGMYVGASSTQAADLDGYIPLIKACMGGAGDGGDFDAAAFGSKLMSEVNPLIMLQNLMNNSLCFGTMTLDLRGVNANFMDFQISGLRAVGEAFRAVATGRADACVAGGVATHVDPSQVREGVDSGYLARTRELDEPPSAVVRPYDARRVGTILSEGTAYVLLEEEGHARRRGAPVLARVHGFGMGSDGATNFGAPHASKGLALALARAAEDAGAAPGDLGFIVGHGSGSLHADGAEARVYAEALGAAPVPITSPKGVLGDLCEAGGVLALILAVETLATGEVPPTFNFRAGDAEAARLRISAEPQAVRRPLALVTARNFLGASCALVVGEA